MKTKLKSLFAVALCAVGLTASALQPSPFRDFWSSHPDPQPVKDPANVIDWGTASMTFESYGAKHGKFLAASADEMIAAYTARIEKDPTDCEAHISRALAYLKKAGENPAFDRLAKEFGYTFDNDTMHIEGELIHEKGVTPEMNDASDEVCDILLPLMEKAYEDLCAIPKNWKGSVAITPDVYPVDEAAYFDYADSLGARAALAELMCVLNMVKGFDVAMDSDKLEDTFNAINQSNGKRGVQALFENNPEFFSKVRDQKALTEAGDWWASAATLLDQWDKAHCRRSDDKLHFFDWNYEKLDSNGTYGLEWLRRQSAELANLPYWASPLDYTKINGEEEHFTSFKPLFEGKFLRKDLPEFGVGVKAPYCNEPLIDTLPDSTLCGIWPSVSPIYFATYVSTRWTDIPAYTTNTTASVYGVWYKNMFDLGFNNEGNPLWFAWDNATPIKLLDPEFNVRGVTAVFKGWSGVIHDGNKPITFEGSEIPTPIGEPMKYVWRRVELTANFDIPKVTYLDLDETAGKPVERTDECELVTANTTEFTTGKVYAVAGDVTVANRITVWSTPENPAKLVLCDGATLWATNGVEVDVFGTATNALVICGQALGTGTLEATGGYNQSGIGGGGSTTGKKGVVCGIVTINGGTVIAKGGDYGAGIGGGAQLFQKGDGGTVTINGGTVTATGGDCGAGIGGGSFADGGTVTINGGTVTATGGGDSFFGAGIGAGDKGTSHGTVKFGAGIASGVEAGELERRGGYVKPFYMTTAEYVADHHLQYVMLPCFSLKIPEATEGYSYEVSYEGAQPNAVLADGTNTYAIAAGATARVRFTLDEDHVWTKEPEDNPILIKDFSRDMVLGEGDLPTVKFEKKGSEGNPWTVGKTTLDSVSAYTNGVGGLVVEGEGNMQDFTEDDPAPWGTDVTEVEIGEDVTSIGARAFAGSQLGSVTVEAMTPPALGEGAFGKLAEGFKIAVPAGAGAAYKAAPGWSDYADSIVEGKPGSPGNPWPVGTTADDSVVAWTNGTGGLVIEGAGAMKAFNGKTDPAPWGDSITEVEIGEDVTSIGANAFNGSTALTDVTLKATQPPVVGMNAFKGCDALEAINVPLWSSGAYKHADTWSDYADGIVEPEQPKIWADGYRIAADKQVGVCSWTWHGSISNVLEQMAADGRYNGMQLALAPWLGIDSASLYFGDQEGPEVWEFIKERVADGSLNVMSTMINFPKEDYTTLTSITNTQGYMYGVAEKWADAEEQWKTNLYFTAEAARLSQELGVDTLSTEAGFIIVNETLMFDRMKEVCMTCAVHGVQLLIESGPQNSLQLTNLLVNLEKEGYTNVGINFDPGDTELFGSENPVDSFKIMKPWIRMIHVKDCKENDRSKKGWNEDCVWGDGVVSQMDFNDNKADPRHFLEQLTAEGYAGDILYERLSGDETLTPARKEEITLAMDRIFAALPEPIAAESDEFTVDLRTNIKFDEGKTRIDVVTWSATAWGAVPGSKFTDLGFMNKTTGATGVLAEGLVGENLDDCALPKKDGEYVLTHSTGDLKSFVTFVVSGYPLGCESNPWTVGPADDPERTVAWKDGKDAIVYLKPPRSAVSRAGLEAVTNAMGGASFDMMLVSADRSATNDVKMIIGASGKQYTSLEEMLESDEDSWTLYDVTGCVASYDGRGAAGKMASDTFLPGIPTNLTANAFTAVGYTFQGWTTNGDIRVIFKDKAKIDDPQPGDIYDLKAVWKSAPVTVKTFEQLENALDAAAEQGSELPVTLKVSGTITVPSDKKVEVPGDPTKAMVRLTGSGSIKGYVKTGGNLDVGSVKILPWTVGTGVTAYIDENGTLHIKGNGKMKDFTEANPAPWGDVASDIKAIDVAEGVTKVGNAAFEALDYAETTTALTFQDEDHVLNLLAFVSADGSETNAPLASAFSVFKSELGTVETVAAFYSEETWMFYDTIPWALSKGEDSLQLMTLEDVKDAFRADFIETAGEKPYSAAMQDLLGQALQELDEAKSIYEISAVADKYIEPLEKQAGKDESHEIEGTKITWRVMDGTLVISGEGEMPDFVAPDFPEGAPWNEMKDDITNVTVAAGIASIGDAAFAVCPAFDVSSVLFKDPEQVINLGAFVSGDGSVTNVPTVKVEIVTEDGRKLRVVPGGWTEGTNTYKTIAAAIAAGAESVTATFEKETKDEPVVVPPAEVEEVVKTVADPDDPEKEIELTATYENVPTDGGSTTGLVSMVENLPLIVDNTGSNITVVVTATNKNEVAIEVVKKMDGAMSNDCETVKAILALDVETKNFDSDYLDMSAYFSFKNDSGRLVEFTKSIIAHIPMKLYDGQIYSVSRRHEGVTEVLPMWYAGIDDDEEVAATNEWVKADVANQELVVKTRRFCDYALGTLELEKTCTIYVNDGGKTLGDEDPRSLATNFQVRVTGAVNVSDFAGYAKRAKGEAAGDYAINFVCTKMPKGYDGPFVVEPGTFKIVMGEKLPADGTVKYPSTYKVKKVDTGLLKEKANATWSATAAKGSVFAGWIAEDGAPASVTNHLAAFSTNELRNAKLTFKVLEGEQIAPTNVAATWARIDEDLIESVAIDTNGLYVVTKSYVTATVSGLPSGLKFNAKTLAITGKVKAKDKTYAVKVSVKNASGYTWKQTFGFVVEGNEVKAVVPAEDCATTGVAVLVRCDPAMGSVKGTGVYALKLDKKTGIWSKQVSINATAKSGYVFAGWYLDPGFSEPAYALSAAGNSKDYRQALQTITVTGPTYLFARFVAKTTKADPITHLRFLGAGYCGADASEFAEEETWYQGVALPTNGCAVAFGSLSLPTVTVSGLPAGVKYDKLAQRFTGAPTACSTEKKPFFTVKISVKNKSGATDVLVKYVYVEPLPVWAVGNFDGYHMENGATNGTFAATVGKTGKVSGKTKGGLAATSFSAKSFASVKLVEGALCYIADVTVSYKDPLTKKTVKEPDTFYVMENPETGLGMIGGGDKDGNGCVAVQRAWDRKDLALSAFPTGKKALTLALDSDITLKFGAKGKVTLAGKVTGDNDKLVTVSGSTYVLPFAWQDAACLRTQVYVYVAPKKNLADGVSEVYDVYLTTNADGEFAAASFTPPVPPEP